MTPKRKRLWLLVGSLAALGVAAALVLTALNDNIVFFYSPSQLAEKKLSPDRRFRLGGLVEQGSVKKDGQLVRFKVTDLQQTVDVVYRGLLPDLFREGQGVIAEGSLGADGVFTAREVLAKHDENYMPPEVAKALKRAGAGRKAAGSDGGRQRLQTATGRAAARHRVSTIMLRSARLRAQRSAAALTARCGRHDPELGHYALILALAVALVQGTLPLVGAARGDVRLMALGRTAALTQAFLVILAFGALTQAYVTSDFSVANVVANSHSAKPLIYKISGVWGNHEGSMLLWALILALFGAAVAIFGTNLPDSLRARVLAVQALIGVGFLAFLLFTSNPFERVFPAPPDGNGLNPLLQDPGLAFHPPLLYLGYVGFSVTYAFAIAALLEGRVDVAWARWVRPWTLAAWCFLTLGIALGSWWAYYILGWGGFWFWDPVENASLMPWLAGTALLHSAIVVEKRDALKSWTVLLAILAFSLSPARHLPGALGRAHLGACLRPGSGARHVHPGLPAARHRRRTGALCLAGAEAGIGRALPADQPRRRADPEQPAALHARRDRAAGHALPAVPRSPDRRQGLGRPAVLQRHLRADLPGAVRRALRRPVSSAGSAPSSGRRWPACAPPSPSR